MYSILRRAFAALVDDSYFGIFRLAFILSSMMMMAVMMMRRLPLPNLDLKRLVCRLVLIKQQGKQFGSNKAQSSIGSGTIGEHAVKTALSGVFVSHECDLEQARDHNV